MSDRVMTQTTCPDHLLKLRNGSLCPSGGGHHVPAHRLGKADRRGRVIREDR